MRKSILGLALAGTVALGACTSNPRMNSDIATGAAVGAAGGAAVGALAPGISTINAFGTGATTNQVQTNQFQQRQQQQQQQQQQQ